MPAISVLCSMLHDVQHILILVYNGSSRYCSSNNFSKRTSNKLSELQRSKSLSWGRADSPAMPLPWPLIAFHPPRLVYSGQVSADV
jgi:hypothetical protein